MLNHQMKQAGFPLQVPQKSISVIFRVFRLDHLVMQNAGIISLISGFDRHSYVITAMRMSRKAIQPPPELLVISLYRTREKRTSGAERKKVILSIFDHQNSINICLLCVRVNCKYSLVFYCLTKHPFVRSFYRHQVLCFQKTYQLLSFFNLKKKKLKN